MAAGMPGAGAEGAARPAEGYGRIRPRYEGIAQLARNIFKLLVVTGLGLALAYGWQDIKRFVKIKQISASGTHPEQIPVHGRTVYPSSSFDAEPDGTGDFDSASRGGPILS